MNAIQTAYIQAKAAVVEAQNQLDAYLMPADDAILTVEEWNGLEYAFDAFVERVQIDLKWQVLRMAEETLLDWGYTFLSRKAHIGEERNALETMYATTNVNARKNLISLILKIEA